MKHYIVASLTILLVACGTEEAAEQSEEIQESIVETIEKELETNNDRKSPRTALNITTNELSFSVDYGSPRVKGRTIWGELVKYDKVWRAGADETTAITFDQPVLFDGNPVAAGTYALFILPKQEGAWKVILNEEWSKAEHDVWGAYDYDATKDVVSIEVSPESLSEPVENLTYDFKEDTFIFKWDRIQLSISLEAAAAV